MNVFLDIVKNCNVELENYECLFKNSTKYQRNIDAKETLYRKKNQKKIDIKTLV